MDMEHFTAAAEQQLSRLRQHVLVASCSSPASMAGALEGAARVYEHAEALTRSAALAADEVERELEASVALLDACAAARDVLAAMRACALDVEAAVRRRRDGGAAAERAARACARLARRVCADARRQRRRAGSTTSEHALQEARRLTVAVLERVMTALSRRVAAAAGGAPRQANSWSTCVARAFRKNARVACEDAADESLPSLLASKDSHDGEAAVQVQREMRALGDTIQQLEDGLDLLFRRLLQCRVFLLNMSSC